MCTIVDAKKTQEYLDAWTDGQPRTFYKAVRVSDYHKDVLLSPYMDTLLTPGTNTPLSTLFRANHIDCLADGQALNGGVCHCFLEENGNEMLISEYLYSGLDRPTTVAWLSKMITIPIKIKKEHFVAIGEFDCYKNIWCVVCTEYEISEEDYKNALKRGE